MASWADLFNDEYSIEKQKKEKSSIKCIDMVSSDVNKCKVCYDGQSVYANTTFYPGDIIEICPTRKVNITSLYSDDVRKIVFEVIPKELYVIPFGYCQYYDIVSKQNPIANCDYLWNSDNNTIVIQAIKKIQKYELLVLNINR